MKKIIIAIDGFSSCGKSTMAKELAKKINYTYIDSGAIYRAITLFSLENNLIDSNGEVKIDELNDILHTIIIDFKFNPNSEDSETLLNGKNVESKIRDLEVASHTSKVSSIGEVRKYVDSILRKFGEQKGIIMDGRDIGTAVFPNAELKIFITAEPTIRAERRYKELIAKGTQVTLEEVLENLRNRDKMDTTRKDNPLIKAEDALVLDNSFLNKHDQAEWLINVYNNVISNL